MPVLAPALLALSSLLLAQASPAGAERSPTIEEGFVSLFDGRTLEGWEGSRDVFRVRDGAIVGGSLDRPVEHNEFLATRREFGDFELRLEARLVGEGRNAGVQFRSRRIPDHFEVIGYQCDMGEMQDRNIWGWLYDESRRKKFLAEAPADKLTATFRPQEWNELTIRCQGPRIRIWVNGVATVDFTEADESIERRGLIAVQIHGGPPAEASYRRIRIRELAAER